MIVLPNESGAIARNNALRLAYEEHYAYLLRVCVLLTGQYQEAEDIVQEAFVRAAPRIDDMKSEAIRPYMRQAVLNMCRNRWRRLKLEQRLRLGRSPQVLSAEQEIGNRDAVWRALMLLPPRQRACLVLRYYEDLSELNVSRLLGCSVGTVKSQCSRGLAKMQRSLDSED